MTSHMNAWLKDAEEFELPPNMLKGMAFITALCHCVWAPDEDRGLEILARMSPPLIDRYPFTDTCKGANYDASAVARLFVEFAGLRGETIEPKMITLPSGTLFPAFPSVETKKLPEDDLRSGSMYDFDYTVHHFAWQLGSHLWEEDLEGWFLSGMHFYAYFCSIDKENTMLLGELLLEGLPPDLRWLCLSLTYETGTYENLLIFTKVLSAFPTFGGEWFQRMLTGLASYFYFDGEGNENHDVIDAPLQATVVDGIRYAELYRRRIVQQEHAEIALQEIANQGIDSPPSNQAMHEAANLVLDVIKDKWGYYVWEEAEDITARGAKLTRHCCILITALVLALHNPHWLSNEIRFDADP